MSNGFSPGGFGAMRQFEHTAESIAVKPAPLTQEQIAKMKYERENRFETIKVPGRECAFFIDGQTFTARPHPRYGWVADVPIRRLHELTGGGKQIDLGQACWVQLSFEGAPERIG